MRLVKKKFSKWALKRRKSFSLFALYLGDKIDFKKLQENLKKYLYLKRDHVIVLKLGPEQFAVLAKFGIVTFWNISKNDTVSFIKEVSPYVENFDPRQLYSDVLKVFIDKEVEDVRFGKVFLTDLDKEKIEIISFVLSQSVALEKYETEIEERILQMEKVINVLKSGSWKELKEKDLVSEIGKILAVKQKAISYLSLFDKPQITWERMEIERLYNKLYYELELADRFDILDEKIRFLSEHHKTLLDFVSTQRSYFLEMIIVILIFVEILFFIFEILAKLK